ncbi:MAG: GDSL-type esterase/lipase family protein [bacterium]
MIFRFFCFLLLVSSLFFASLADNVFYPEIPETMHNDKGPYPVWFDHHKQIIAQASTGKAEVIFMGDSITDYFTTVGKDTWDKYYVPLGAVDCGISGDSTPQVLWRANHGELDGVKAKVAVLMIGTNGISGVPYLKPEDTVRGIAAIISTIRVKAPNTKVLLLGIFPRSTKENPAIMNKINAVNQLLPALADNDKIFYLNINANFLQQDGNVSLKLLSDGLHPSADGYAVWANAMNPLLYQLLDRTADGKAIDTSTAPLRLPAIFSDNMVLQRDKKNPVWGWCAPNEKVHITINKKKVSATADKDGKWNALLPWLPVNGVYVMTVQWRDKIIKVKNILVGDVWVCSGQSNMVKMVQEAGNAEEEIAAADHPTIRMITLNRVTTTVPAPDIIGNWEVCTPDTVAEFSGMAYYFARELQKKVKVPIGLIVSAWGGAAIEGFIPTDTPMTDPKTGAVITVDYAKALQMQNQYLQDILNYGPKDQSRMGINHDWENPLYSDADWITLDVPNTWGKYTPSISGTGGAWFRKEVTIPSAWQGKELVLKLGRIAWADDSYWNGALIGHTGWDNKPLVDCGDTRRRYKIPAALVKEGKVLIAVHVIDPGFWGDFGGIADTPLSLGSVGKPDQEISLIGAWKFKQEFTRKDKDLTPYPRPSRDTINMQKDGVLFKGMISPLIPYGMKGVIWYQGESSAPKAYQYRTQFPAMITAWRKAWRQGDFPFLFMEIATVGPPPKDPKDSTWAELRESQRFALALPNTGMAVTIDHPDRGEIHPKNKQEAGSRLSQVALAKVYGFKVPYENPTYSKMKVTGKEVRISFDHLNGGLVTKGADDLAGFAIAGDDKKFVWAHARKVGDEVVVWSDDILTPAAVRYAWAETPMLSIYSKTGLPTSSFRTDDWVLSTQK